MSVLSVWYILCSRIVKVLLCAEVASAPALVYLDLSHNSLSSTLPVDWTSNVGLEFLKLDHNQLTGKNGKGLLKSCCPPSIYALP